MNEKIKELLVKSGMLQEDLMKIFDGNSANINEFYLNNFAQLLIKATLHQIICSYKGHINPTIGVNAVKEYFEYE